MSLKSFWNYKTYRIKEYKKHTRIFPHAGKSIKIDGRFGSKKETINFIRLMFNEPT